MALVFLLPLVASAQPAADAVVPAQEVDFAFVKAQLTFPAKPEVTLIDTRGANSGFDAGHIPGAINVPNDGLADALPRDRKQLLVFYCEDAQRDSSRQAAARATELGYSNSRTYVGGFADWLKNGGQASVSAAYIDKLKAERVPHVLIDARPTRTAAKGMIPDAINIPDAEFDKHVGKLPPNKTARLIFYCGGLDCPQSSSAAEKARKLGYTNVLTYPEGYPEWKELHESGQPAVK